LYLPSQTLYSTNALPVAQQQQQYSMSRRRSFCVGIVLERM
jgi:hypothetical protein